jgi:hypothetical protein
LETYTEPEVCLFEVIIFQSVWSDSNYRINSSKVLIITMVLTGGCMCGAIRYQADGMKSWSWSPLISHSAGSDLKIQLISLMLKPFAIAGIARKYVYLYGCKLIGIINSCVVDRRVIHNECDHSPGIIQAGQR